jgi:CBS domain-containing protein
LGQQINQVHDALIQRTTQIAEHLLEDEGYGKPPVAYAFILLGSGGRREQTLWSDQDNGLIYGDSETHTQDELDLYFDRLASYIIRGWMCWVILLVKGMSYPVIRNGASRCKDIRR